MQSKSFLGQVPTGSHEEAFRADSYGALRTVLGLSLFDKSDQNSA